MRFHSGSFSARSFMTITITIIIMSALLYAQQRPQRGSVSFGASEKPVKEDIEGIESFRRIFVRVAEKVIPSVVAVVPTKVDTVLFYRNPFYRFFDEENSNNSPFDYFFGPRQSDPEVERQERRVQALGSGVIVSENGYVLTNFHVINGAQEIEVRLSDGRVFQAKFAGSDSLSDVAVIKISGKVPSDLPVAYLGNSDSLMPGDWVAAIGNPFSLLSSVTQGIVSALNRQVDDLTTYQNFIQTDAAINPGNSGGALVNIYGEVIGINTVIYSKTGGFMGIGFAIPINMARRVMEDLIYEGKVVRGWIGVSIQELTPVIRDALGVQAAQGGVLISDIFKNQPAEKSGIRRGDIIVSINDKRIETTNDLRNVIASIRPGSDVKVTLIREGKKITLKMKVTERTPETMEQTPPERSGFREDQEPERGMVNNPSGIAVTDITTDTRQQYTLPPNATGVIVIRIDPAITDARTTLMQGDLIIQGKVQGKAVKNLRSVKEFDQFIKSLRTGQSLMLLANRNGATFYVPFSFSK